MRFDDRKEFLYDPAVFKRADTRTALQIHEEYVRRHSANPPPHFFEVDRQQGNIDQLWHMPLTDRTLFSRELEMPAINIFEKPLWKLTRFGIVPKRSDTFWLANNILQKLDYFPMRGDLVYWNGYRYMIENTIISPDAYWHQTNVWLGMVCGCIIPPDGDARPLVNPSEAAPAEAGQGLVTVPAGEQPPFDPLRRGRQGL